MAEQVDGALKTLVTGEAINRYRLMRINSSGAWVYCDADEFPTALARNYCANGESLAGYLLAQKEGTIKCMASGAISTAYVPVYTDDDGKVTATAGGVQVGVAIDTASADGSIVEVIPDVKRVPQVNVANDAVKGASSTDEVDCGITYTIPASELRVGSIIRARVHGIVADQAITPQCVVKLYVGTEVIATATVAAAADNDECIILADIVVRVVGASGNVEAFCAHAFGAAGTAVGTRKKAAAAEDLSAGAVLKVTVQFNASHADNQFRLDHFEVEHVR